MDKPTMKTALFAIRFVSAEDAKSISANDAGIVTDSPRMIATAKELVSYADDRSVLIIQPII